jgi:hypothetical protein
MAKNINFKDPLDPGTDSESEEDNESKKIPKHI